MKTEVHLTPETEEEVELLERLVEVRRFAIEDTELSPSSIAGIFAQMSAGMAGEEESYETASDAIQCPVCGNNAQEVTAGEIGGKPIVEPCGCEADWDDLPPDIYLEDT